MSKIEKAVQYAESIASDNYHGYSQARRGDRDTDCSKIVIDGLKAAGFNTGGASYTGDMLAPLLTAGFENIASRINLRTGAGLQRGDILLRPKTATKGGHAAFFIGNGQIVQAQSDYDGRYGDGNGREIRKQAYYDSPFIYVLRYPEADPCLFAIKVVADTWIHKTPDASIESRDHIALAKDKLTLGIAEVSGTWGRIQNQPNLWISINPDYPGVVRV